jgi:NAD(P)-dependent dehydrogenase (short-subunit alcohol dehydrogenase family)
MGRSVVVTGANSGIGLSTAVELARHGYDVVGTVRSEEKGEHLLRTAAEKDAVVRYVVCDVADAESTEQAFAEVAAMTADDGLWAVVNNAGFGLGGPVEETSDEAAREIFETNVLGPMRICRLVLPGMRERGDGRIVNISSMGANFVFPGGGYYHATKFAVDALTDALRFEVKGFGIDAVIIQPGLIMTNFGDAAVGSMETTTDDNGPYAQFNAKLAEATKGVYEQGPAAKLGGPPEAVAKTIEKAITTKRPKPRYLVTPSAHLLVNQRRLMPDRVWDRFLRTQFPQPK